VRVSTPVARDWSRRILDAGRIRLARAVAAVTTRIERGDEAKSFTVGPPSRTPKKRSSGLFSGTFSKVRRRTSILVRAQNRRFPFGRKV